MHVYASWDYMHLRAVSYFYFLFACNGQCYMHYKRSILASLVPIRTLFSPLPMELFEKGFYCTCTVPSQRVWYAFYMHPGILCILGPYQMFLSLPARGNAACILRGLQLVERFPGTPPIMGVCGCFVLHH